MTTVDGSDAETDGSTPEIDPPDAKDDRPGARIDALEAELAEIDAEIDDLSSRDSGFDLASEIRRLRSVLFDDGRSSADGPSQRFSSKRERVERIRELQRQREQVLRELAARRNSRYFPSSVIS